VTVTKKNVENAEDYLAEVRAGGTFGRLFEYF